MKNKDWPPAEFLKRRLLLAEAARELNDLSSEVGLPLSPAWVDRWNEFRSQLGNDDELWYWENFPQAMTGGAGYCILRKGRSIAWIATMRS